MTTVLAADPRLDRGMGLLQATATNNLTQISAIREAACPSP